LHKAGNFDEDFFCYFEDVDLGFRLRLSGYRCLFVPGAVAQHVGSGTSGGQHSDFATYHGHRNIVWTFVKNMPGVLFWLLLPLHLALNVVTLFWFAGHGRAGVIFRGQTGCHIGIAEDVAKTSGHSKTKGGFNQGHLETVGYNDENKRIDINGLIHTH
jgi:GT2 family glycosyltransferase